MWKLRLKGLHDLLKVMQLLQGIRRTKKKLEMTEPDSKDSKVSSSLQGKVVKIHASWCGNSCVVVSKADSTLCHKNTWEGLGPSCKDKAHVTGEWQSQGYIHGKASLITSKESLVREQACVPRANRRQLSI